MLLHFQTRRVLCRLAFLACCAAPTAGLLAWGGWLQLPAHVAAQSAKLSRELNLPVTVERVEYPQPGLAQYVGLQLCDALTREPLLRASHVEAGGNGATQVLIASGVEIETAAAPRLLETLAALLKPTQLPASDVRIHLAEFSLRLPDRTETLTDLVATLGTIEGDRSADLQFRVRGLEMSHPARVRMFRRANTTSALGFQLDTGDTPLPGWLIGLVAPGFAELGERATFRGQILAEELPGGWRGELRGVLAGLQMNQLVAGRVPHRLDGLAELRIDQAKFSAGRLETASGTVMAGPGFIGKSLVIAAVETLEMTWGEPARSPQPMLPYQQMAFAFWLDARGLQLRGACTEGPEQSVMVDQGQVLLGEWRRERQPVALAIRTFLPPSETLVQANRQSAWLLQFLPLPQ